MRKIKNICLMILALVAAYGLGAFITWFTYGEYLPWNCVGGVLFGLIYGFCGIYVFRKNDSVIEFGKIRVYATTLVATLFAIAMMLLAAGLMVLTARWLHYSDINLIYNASSAWSELFGIWFVFLMGSRIRRENDAKKKDTVEKSFASVKNE